MSLSSAHGLLHRSLPTERSSGTVLSFAKRVFLLESQKAGGAGTAVTRPTPADRNDDDDDARCSSTNGPLVGNTSCSCTSRSGLPGSAREPMLGLTACDDRFFRRELTSPARGDTFTFGLAKVRRFAEPGRDEAHNAVATSGNHSRTTSSAAGRTNYFNFLFLLNRLSVTRSWTFHFLMVQVGFPFGYLAPCGVVALLPSCMRCP